MLQYMMNSYIYEFMCSFYIGKFNIKLIKIFIIFNKIHQKILKYQSICYIQCDPLKVKTHIYINNNKTYLKEENF